MGDLVNIRISSDADKVAELLKKRYYFSTNTAVYRFAMAYAIRDFKDELVSNYEQLDNSYPSDGTNLNVGTVDNNQNLLKQLIPILVPECSTPYRFVRVAIILGLYKIKQMIDEDNNVDIIQQILK